MRFKRALVALGAAGLLGWLATACPAPVPPQPSEPCPSGTAWEHEADEGWECDRVDD